MFLSHKIIPWCWLCISFKTIFSVFFPSGVTLDSPILAAQYEKNKIIFIFDLSKPFRVYLNWFITSMIHVEIHSFWVTDSRLWRPDNRHRLSTWTNQATTPFYQGKTKCVSYLWICPLNEKGLLWWWQNLYVGDVFNVKNPSSTSQIGLQHPSPISMSPSVDRILQWIKRGPFPFWCAESLIGIVRSGSLGNSIWVRIQKLIFGW